MRGDEIGTTPASPFTNKKGGMMKRVQDKNQNTLPKEQIMRVFHKGKGKAEVLIQGACKPKRIFVKKDGHLWKDQFGHKHDLIFPEA
jgi:hypothetical protein